MYEGDLVSLSDHLYDDSHPGTPAGGGNGALAPLPALPDLTKSYKTGGDKPG